MALLDMQALEAESDNRGGYGGGSHVSLLLCDSTASLTLCL
jgi:hypothetical protein